MADCPFCEIVAGRAPAEKVREWDHALAIVPLAPVTPGHVLVIPKRHVQDAGVLPWLTGRVFQCAAEMINEVGPANLITSVGAEATQTIFHLHLHLVPRHEGDGLALPWTGSRSGACPSGGPAAAPRPDRPGRGATPIEGHAP